MSEASDSIIQKLTAQRTLLVDVVRQIDTAIAVFGGVPTNGNGHRERVLSWTQRPENRAKLLRIRRAAARTRAQKRQQQQQAPGTFEPA